MTTEAGTTEKPLRKDALRDQTVGQLLELLS